MKIISLKSIVTLLVFLFLGMTAQAQFWKKIKDRAKEAAEETVMRKAEEKAAQETEKAFDKVFDMDFGKEASNIDPAILQGTYTYSWKYTLQMQHKQGAMNLHYYLREDGTDFGNKFEMEGREIMPGMFMVFDQAAGVTAILNERNGKKFGQIMSSPTDDLAAVVEAENPLSDAEFKEVGTKTILGYECQGFEIENSDMRMTMWVAFDTPVSFNQVYAGTSDNRLPKGFDRKWLDKIGDNSLMMEMDMINKKKPKKSAKMTCVALEQEDVIIDMSEYEFPQVEMQEQAEEID